MTFTYYADLEVNYADGSFGAKRFEALSMGAAQRKADAKLKEVIETSKFAKKCEADKTFEVVSYKISSGKLDV